MHLLTLLTLGAVALASAGVDGATVVVLDGSDWQLSPRLNSSAAGSRSAVKATVPGGVWDNLERAGRVSYSSRRPAGVVLAGHVARTCLSERHMRNYLGIGMKMQAFITEGIPWDE